MGKVGEWQGGMEEEGENLCPHPGSIVGLTATYTPKIWKLSDFLFSATILRL